MAAVDPGSVSPSANIWFRRWKLSKTTRSVCEKYCEQKAEEIRRKRKLSQRRKNATVTAHRSLEHGPCFQELAAPKFEVRRNNRSIHPQRPRQPPKSRTRRWVSSNAPVTGPQAGQWGWPEGRTLPMPARILALSPLRRDWRPGWAKEAPEHTSHPWANVSPGTPCKERAEVSGGREGKCCSPLIR